MCSGDQGAFKLSIKQKHYWQAFKGLRAIFKEKGTTIGRHPNGATCHLGRFFEWPMHTAGIRTLTYNPGGET